MSVLPAPGTVFPAPVELGQTKGKEIVAGGMVEQLGCAAVTGAGGDAGLQEGAGQGTLLTPEIDRAIEPVQLAHESAGQGAAAADEVTPGPGTGGQGIDPPAQGLNPLFRGPAYGGEPAGGKKGPHPALHLPRPSVLAGKGAEHCAGAVRPATDQDPEHLAPFRAKERCRGKTRLGPGPGPGKVDATFPVQAGHKLLAAGNGVSRWQPVLPAAVTAETRAAGIVGTVRTDDLRNLEPVYFLNSHRSRVRTRLTTMEEVSGK